MTTSSSTEKARTRTARVHRAGVPVMTIAIDEPIATYTASAKGKGKGKAMTEKTKAKAIVALAAAGLGDVVPAQHRSEPLPQAMVPAAEKPATPSTPTTPTRRRVAAIPVGAECVKVYDGKRFDIIRTETGYEMGGALYETLSPILVVITGREKALRICRKQFLDFELNGVPVYGPKFDRLQARQPGERQPQTPRAAKKAEPVRETEPTEEF